MDRALQPVGAPWRVGHERHENVRILEQREVKCVRQHSDDDERRTVDHDGSVERAPAGERAGKALAHDGYTGPDRRVLVLKEIATGRYPDSEEPEEAGRHLRAAQHARLVAHADGAVGGVVGFEGAEAFGTRAPVQERGIRCWAPLGGTRTHLPEMHEALRVGIWERLNQRGIGGREDRRGRA